MEGGGGVFWARGQRVQRPWGESDLGTFANGKQTRVAGGWGTRRRVVGDGGGESGSRGRYCWDFLLSVRGGIGGEKQWRCLVFPCSYPLEATGQLLVSSDGVGGYLQGGWGHKDDVGGKHNHIY